MNEQKINCTLAVFDLDGTLMASDNTIFTAMDTTLREMNIPHSITREKLLSMIGAHFQDVFDAFGVTIPDLEAYIEQYKVHYYNLLHLSSLYPGIEDTLIDLKKNCIQLALLTTKGQEQAERILSEFNLAKYFTYISGRQKGRLVKPAPEPLLEICGYFGVAPDATVMIGDTEYDIRCGKNAGTKTIACLYGYRTAEFINSEAPDYIVASPSEIPSLFY